MPSAVDKRSHQQCPYSADAGNELTSHGACCSEDRRITRSKRAMRAALIQLIEEKGIEAITVNDLCTAADLNRGTFYNHFRDKDHLLESFEDEIMADLTRLQQGMSRLSLRDIVQVRIKGKPLPLLVQLFDYLREQEPLLHALLGPGGDVRFSGRMRDTICTDLVRSVLHECYRTSKDPFVNYYIAFAYYGVIARWIETGMKESSEQMALIAVRLLFIKAGEPIRM